MLKKINKLVTILVLLAISIVVVFFLVREKNNPNDQYVTTGSEVLMGSECGFDYLPCCKTEPKCSFGQQCCVDPNDQDRTYCSDECTCGSEDEFCCANNVCNDGLVCHFGNCHECGGEGEICCPESNSCDEGFSCYNGECVECGLEGNPCCEKENCKTTDKGEMECFSGLCQLCGFDGLRACKEQEPCLSGHLFNNNTCYICGDFNQPCCNKEAKTGYDCNPEKNLICDLGFCKLP